jgi:hypothetical protein
VGKVLEPCLNFPLGDEDGDALFGGARPVQLPQQLLIAPVNRHLICVGCRHQHAVHTGAPRTLLSYFGGELASYKGFPRAGPPRIGTNSDPSRVVTQSSQQSAKEAFVLPVLAQEYNVGLSTHPPTPALRFPRAAVLRHFRR